MKHWSTRFQFDSCVFQTKELVLGISPVSAPIPLSEGERQTDRQIETLVKLSQKLGVKI